jgi:hypothetical protein
MKNIFKNILRPTIILPLIGLVATTSTFLACSENHDGIVRDKLSAFENQLRNKMYSHNQARKIQYNEASLKNEKNKYDYEGELILKKHKNIEEYVNATIVNPDATYENTLKPFISQQISDFSKISLADLNPDEKMLLESFQKNFKPSVELVLDYEDFVYENYPDQSKMKNFLIIISRIKYDIFVSDSDASNKRTLSGWESCVVQCVRAEYANLNVVDWVGFALNPGGSVLWTAASCGWDCRMDNYYGH